MYRWPTSHGERVLRTWVQGLRGGCVLAAHVAYDITCNWPLLAGQRLGRIYLAEKKRDGGKVIGGVSSAPARQILLFSFPNRCGAVLCRRAAVRPRVHLKDLKHGGVGLATGQTKSLTIFPRPRHKAARKRGSQPRHSRRGSRSSLQM